MKNFFSRWIALGVLVVGMTPLAQAYSPPAGFILSKLLKEREKVKTLDLDGRFSSPTSGGTIKESLRIDFAANKIIAVYSTESGESLGTHVTKIQDLPTLGKAWIGIGMDPYGNRVRAILEDLDVYPKESTEVRIDRVAGKPVWAWGQMNQLKILKDEFLFAGYQGDDDDAIDVLNFTAKEGVVRLPKKVWIKKGSFTYELKGFKLNAGPKSSPNPTSIRSPVVREWVELVR